MIADCHAYRVLKTPALLKDAREMMDFIIGKQCDGVLGGGVWWKSSERGGKHACSCYPAVIAACGMLEMAKYLSQEEAAYYTSIARKLLKAIYDACRVTDPEESNGLLLHGTYSKKSPYNTCTPEGVDECVIWGDYYWMEALNRLYNPSWHIYW